LSLTPTMTAPSGNRRSRASSPRASRRMPWRFIACPPCFVASCCPCASAGNLGGHPGADRGWCGSSRRSPCSFLSLDLRDGQKRHEGRKSGLVLVAAGLAVLEEPGVAVVQLQLRLLEDEGLRDLDWVARLDHHVLDHERAVVVVPVRILKDQRDG